MSEWQHAIDAEGFPLRLPEDAPLANSKGGNLIAKLRDNEVGVEYTIADLRELKETYKDFNFGRDWKLVLAFTWFAKLSDGVAAWMAATAYARATGGAVFDEQEQKIFTPEESLQIAQDIDRSLPEMEATLQNFMQRLSAKS
jgi:hypothetical protein